MNIDGKLGERLRAQRLVMLQERYYKLELDKISVQACMDKADQNPADLEKFTKEIANIEKRQAFLDHAYTVIKTGIGQEAI